MFGKIIFRKKAKYRRVRLIKNIKDDTDNTIIARKGEILNLIKKVGRKAYLVNEKQKALLVGFKDFILVQ